VKVVKLHAVGIFYSVAAEEGRRFLNHDWNAGLEAEARPAVPVNSQAGKPALLPLAIKCHAVGIFHAVAAEDVQRGADGQIHFSSAEPRDLFKIRQ
jgi:hypothetical protein